MWQSCLSRHSAKGYRLALTNRISHFRQRSVVLNVKVSGDTSVIMTDENVVPSEPHCGIALLDLGDNARASRQNLRSDRHDKIPRIEMQTLMAGETSVALR